MDHTIEILQEVTDFYLKSGDFNGLPVRYINLPPEVLRVCIVDLVKGGKVTINFGDVHPNPHIKAFESDPIEGQLEKAERLNLEEACLYPSKEYLMEVVDPKNFVGRPFTLMLAQGEPQLKFLTFDLAILERYRNDPRYSYYIYDTGGMISVRDKHYKSGSLRKQDEILLKTFGFAFDDTTEIDDLCRYVGVYLYYLHTLTPEHQQNWKTKMLSGNYWLHPDYCRALIGHWPEGVSIFHAFTEELHHINEICKLMGRPPLFRQTFRDRERPKEFNFLLRPTLKEFNMFVSTLDKMISDNINSKFFKNEVALEWEEQNPDSSITRRHKGSLTVLSEWLDTMVQLPNPGTKNEMIEAFKKVRGLRQNPAHKIEEDEWDKQYFEKQRALMLEAYKGIRTLRLIFANQPEAQGYRVPEWLQSGRIWQY